MEMNPKQQQALRTDRNITLTAGAGTGKTRVLVERYLGILQQGAGVQSVLALTFTEKAAAEMKIRIKESMLDRLRNSNTRSDIRFWERLFEEFRDPRISTFHAFCAAVLREFPIEAGVDPAFTLMDESQAAVMFEDALEGFLGRADASGHPGLAALCALWERRRIADVLRCLNASRFPALQWSRLYADMYADDIRVAYEQLSESRLRAPDVIGAFSDMLDELNNISCGDDGDKLAPAFYAAREVLDGFIRLGQADLSRLEKIDLRGGSKKNWDDIVQVKNILKRVRDYAGDVAKFQTSACDDVAAGITRVLAGFFLESVEYCNRAKGHGVVLDFDDLEIRVLELLKGNPKIRRLLRGRFRHILIDEFQDTNDIQWEIIQYIARNGRSGELESGIFIVGDDKQSIYAFRGANVAVFERAGSQLEQANAERGADDSGRVELDVCYRSRPELIRFFNTLFTEVFRGGVPEEFLSEIRYFEIDSGRDDGKCEEPCVECLVLEQEKSRREKDRTPAPRAEAEMAAQAIKRLAGGPDKPFDFRDVAVLFRTRTHLNEYKEALRAHGIPFMIVGGMGFFESDEVLDLINVFSFLANPCDNVSLAGVLRSPHFGLSDEDLLAVSVQPGDYFWDKLQAAAGVDVPGRERMAAARDVLARWLGMAGRVPVSTIMRAVCDHTAIYATLAAGPRPEQDRLNLEKLLVMAGSFERREACSLPRFLDAVNHFIDSGAREPEAVIAGQARNAVQLMTVHAAKGLEFPVVVVQGMGDMATARTDRALIIEEVAPGRFEAGFAVPDQESGEIASPIAHQVVRHAQKRKEEEQFKRLLYVACTRARERLILAGVRSYLLDVEPDPAKSTFIYWDEMMCHALNSAGPDTWARHGIVMHREQEEEQSEEPDLETEPASFLGRAQALLPAAAQDVAAVPAMEYFASLERDAGRGMSFSVTEIVTFLNDRDEYVKRHVLAVPAAWAQRADRNKKQEGREIDPLLRGAMAHRLFEELPGMPEDGERDFAWNLAREHGLDAEAAEHFAQNYAARAADFRTTELGRRVSAPDALHELPFTMSVGPWTVTGAMDVIFPDGDCWRIVDYKTDRVSRGDIERKDAHYLPQMELYALAALDALPADRVAAGLFFIEPGVSGQTFVVERDQCAAIRKRLTQTLGDMEALHFKAAKFHYD